MFKNPLSLAEKIVLIGLALIIALGYYLLYTDVNAFKIYTDEDKSVEWLTVVGLLLGCGVSLSRLLKLRKQRSWWFLTVTFLLALMLFVAAGEEISWGQRILGIKSPEYFKEHNTQGETNFHNLIVDGIKVNKIFFSFILTGLMGLYLLVAPILYNKWRWFTNFVDRSGVPIARVYQIIAFVLLFILVSLMWHEKKAEILECGAALLFFLVILNPRNKEIFLKRNDVGITKRTPR